MKICAIICEFNPFHNGHKYLIEQAKALSDCDKIVCFMSGSFTQRGEICIADKFDRARHAVLCGADAVIEMPVSFSVAPAEIFARGAIRLITSLGNVKSLAFGCENGEKTDFINAAEILSNETEIFKNTLNCSLASGESYIKSYEKAFEAVGGKHGLLSKPNNVLAVEYTKAILRSGKNIEILPVKRIGSGYNDGKIADNFSSASAIRNNSASPLIKNNVPDCVFKDLKDFSEENKRFGEYMRLILTRTPAETLKNIYGCGEGLENKLKSLENLPFEEIISTATNRRYSASRIKRILCANFLGLYQNDCEKFLQNSLYIKPLAVKKQGADEMLAGLAKSFYPLITKGRDKLNFEVEALKCLEKDEFSYAQWRLIAQISSSNKSESIVFV